jgi:AcrR family transcriptional regulator
VKATFNHLTESKRRLVIDSCVDEFGEHGYDQGSTDGIVKRSGISKGGLYEYTRSKEELFLFIVDYCYGHLYSFIRDKIRKKGRKVPGDILERMKLVSSVAIDYYIGHPKEIQVIVKAGKLEDPVMTEKVQKVFLKHFMDVFGDIKTDDLRYSRKGILDLVRWMLAKTRNDFLAEAAVTGEVAKVKKAYFESWETIIGVFSNGIYKQKKERN